MQESILFGRPESFFVNCCCDRGDNNLFLTVLFTHTTFTNESLVRH
jgi:hypothetical protein